MEASSHRPRLARSRQAAYSVSLCIIRSSCPQHNELATGTGPSEISGVTSYTPFGPQGGLRRGKLPETLPIAFDSSDITTHSIHRSLDRRKKLGAAHFCPSAAPRSLPCPFRSVSLRPGQKSASKSGSMMSFSVPLTTRSQESRRRTSQGEIARRHCWRHCCCTLDSLVVECRPFDTPDRETSESCLQSVLTHKRSKQDQRGLG